MVFSNSLFISSYMTSVFPKFRFKASLCKDILHFNVGSNILFVFFFILNNHFQFSFKTLSDLAGVDYIFSNYRFQLVYNLLSLRNNLRVLLKSNVSEAMSVFSVSSIVASASWLEREVFDFFGIFFVGHHDLRRILNDYGFSGYPLRKDFPLSGFFEVRYDDRFKKLLVNNLVLPQEFRFYEFKNPWFTFLK